MASAFKESKSCLQSHLKSSVYSPHGSATLELRYFKQNNLTWRLICRLHQHIQKSPERCLRSDYSRTAFTLYANTLCGEHETFGHVAKMSYNLFQNLHEDVNVSLPGTSSGSTLNNFPRARIHRFLSLICISLVFFSLDCEKRAELITK